MAQWIECPPGVPEVMGLIPVKDTVYFSLFHACAMLSLFYMPNVNDYLHYDGII